MWLWYDWRAAAVADSNCNILDSEEWDGWRDTNAVCSRMDIIAHEALTPEAERLLERFPDGKEYFMEDGIHPSKLAYELWSEKLASLSYKLIDLENEL